MLQTPSPKAPVQNPLVSPYFLQNKAYTLLSMASVSEFPALTSLHTLEDPCPTALGWTVLDAHILLLLFFKFYLFIFN